jgi:archaellum component FlaC
MFFGYDDGKNIESFILSCIEDRINDLSNQFNKSSQYSDFYNQYTDTLKKLEQLLTKETYAFILQFDALYEKLSVDYQNFFYKQGFLDCRMVFNLLHK